MTKDDKQKDKRRTRYNWGQWKHVFKKPIVWPNQLLPEKLKITSSPKTRNFIKYAISSDCAKCNEIDTTLLHSKYVDTSITLPVPSDGNPNATKYFHKQIFIPNHIIMNNAKHLPNDNPEFDAHINKSTEITFEDIQHNAISTLLYIATGIAASTLLYYLAGIISCAIFSVVYFVIGIIFIIINSNDNHESQIDDDYFNNEKKDKKKDKKKDNDKKIKEKLAHVATCKKAKLCGFYQEEYDEENKKYDELELITDETNKTESE
ncbi:MAG: hypothetical protein AAFO15_00410 [Pseudomonadota bacterium]